MKKTTDARYCNCDEMTYEDSLGRKIKIPIISRHGAVHSCKYTIARSALVPAADKAAELEADNQGIARYIPCLKRRIGESETIKNPAWKNAWQRAFCAYMDFHELRIMRSTKEA